MHLSSFAIEGSVEQLAVSARVRIMHNIRRIALHLDMDGTLTAAGQPLSERAIHVINRLQSLGVPISCNTAQSHEYLLAAGGDVFKARVNELGLRVQHSDGTVLTTAAPCFAAELAAAHQFVRERHTWHLTLVEKKGGFAMRFCDALGRAASEEHVRRTTQFVCELVRDNQQLTAVRTDGFIDVCSSRLSKRFGALVQMQCKAFKGCFHVAAGDGSTDERMFEVADVAIKVGHEPSRAEARLGSHVHMLDVLEWIAQLRADRRSGGHGVVAVRAFGA